MFPNVNFSNLENVLQRNLGADRSWEHDIRDAILKLYPLGGNHGGAFVNSIYVPVCPKELWIRH